MTPSLVTAREHSTTARAPALQGRDRGAPRCISDPTAFTPIGADAFYKATEMFDLADRERAALLETAVVHTFAKGETLVGPTPSGVLMVLLTGKAALTFEYDGRCAVLALASGPKMLNLDCVVAATDAHRPWRAAETCTVAFVSSDPLRDAMARNAHIAGRVAAALALAYRDMVDAAAAQRLRSAAHRLAEYLLGLSSGDGGLSTVRLPYSKNLLASLLGMTPEHLARAIATLRSHGVRIVGPQVSIQDRPRLTDFLDPHHVGDCPQT